MKFAWCLALAVLFVGCSSGANVVTEEPVEVIKLRFADTMPAAYPATAGAIEFARLVEERSDGRILIQVYAGGLIESDELELVEQLEFGGIDIGRVNSSVMSEYAPTINFLQMTWLYDDTAHMHRVIDSEIGEKILASLEDNGFVGLAVYEAGYRHIYTADAPITSLEDMKDLKIRIPHNQLMIDTINALGAVAVPMNFGEVYNGIRTGLIDGGENNFSSYLEKSHYEVAPYISMTAHTALPELLLFSEMVFDQLSVEDQLLIRQAAADSVVYQRELYQASELTALNFMNHFGIEVFEIEDRDAFVDAIMPVYAKYTAGYEDIVQGIEDLR